MPSPRQVLVGVLGLGLTVTGLSLALPTPAAQAVGGVFISEFHYDDSTANDAGGVGEFVEVTAPAGTDLTGWKIQLVNGNGNTVYRTDTLSGTVSNQVDGWGASVLTYPANTSGGVFQNGSPDGVALLNASNSVVEFISYEGPMTAILGTPGVSTTSVDTGAAAVETNTTPGTHSLQRQTDGSWAAPALATKGTPNGFDTGGDPDPDPVSVTNPGNKTGIVGTPITPFTVAATGGTGSYTWSATGLPTGVSINTSTGEVSGTPSAACTCSVTVTATDSTGTSNATFTFTVTPPAEVVPIHEVQGTGARSPFAPADGNGAGQVKSVEGIVTALYRTGGFNGMFVQTAGTGGPTDATPGASDALFVFGGSNTVNIPSDVVIGDSVQVTGPVSEFFNSTQISPAAGGVVELSSPLAPVAGLEIAYPTTEANREAQEGMLLAPTDTFTVTNTFQTNGFAEIGLATGDVPLRQPTEFAAPGDTAALEAIVADNAARAVTLDDAATVNYLSNQTNKAIPLPWLTGTSSPPRVGAEATFTSPVILEFRNNIWKFQPRAQVTGSGSDVVTFEDTRATNLTPADVGGDLQIATFNVLNYFNTTGEAYVAAGPLQSPPVDTHCTYFTDREGNRIGNNQCGTRGPGIPSPNDGRGPRGAATQVSLERQEDKLVHTIEALDADIIALEEMENSIKLVGETNRDDALAHLVGLLNDAAGTTKWKYVKSPGESTTASAVAEQDVIRNAFIYQPATVAAVGQSDILFGTSEFANAREPLAQAFKAAGAPNSDAFAVIVNHFKSKGDNASPAPPATGDNANNTYTGAFNGDRVRQAQRLVQFANDFAAERNIDEVFLAGDFNSYTMEEPMQALHDGGFEPVESSDDPTEESYSFSGLSGSLDHVLGNTAARALVTGADIWQINANESIAYQYSRFNYNVTSFFNPNDPFATSDHNPEVVGLDVPEVVPTTTKKIQVLGTNDFHGRLLPDGGNAAGAAPYATAVNELRAEVPAGNTIFAAAGDLIGASTFESFIQKDEPTIDALNAMGLEVSAAGNHEFDQGYEDFVGRVQNRADWTYIATNIDEPAGRDDLAESWTKTVDGVDIGFVGAVTEDLPTLVNPSGIEGVGVLDIVTAVNEEAAELKAADVDIIVLLVHEGSPSTDCSSVNFTDPATVWGNIVQNTSSDVDAIVSGHTHLAYNCRYLVQDWVDDSRTVTRRPVVSAGQYGTNLNQLVFNFDTTSGALVEIEQDVIGTAGVGYAPDPAVQEIVDDAVAFANTAGAQVLGQVEGPFNRAVYNPASGQTENRGGESTLGNQVAEVQRWATQLPDQGVEADIAFMNPGGLRADMTGEAPANPGDPRDLTFRQAANVQPFANTLVNMVLTGAQIETVLEQQWQRTPQGSVPSRPFLRLGVSEGFTYTYVETPETVNAPNSAPVSTFRGEVTGMWLNGVPIDPATPYSVTVNSFLGTGGDNFHELANGTNKVDTGRVDLQAMVDYMAAVAPAGTPLPVDYSQRAVEVEFPAGAPEVYGPGDAVAFDVASWTMSTDADTKDNQVQVKLGDEVLGTAPLNNAIGTAPYDTYGKATVSVTLPANITTGDHELTLVGAQTGTEIPVPIEVERETTEIQILGTNDFHGRILQTAANREGGGAVLSGAVKQLRGQNPNTVFAAAGDLIGASTFESFIQKDKPTIDVLNEAGLEVSAVGNHELDAGYDDLVNRVMAAESEENPQGGAAWEYIAANIEEPEGQENIAETWTQPFGDVEVGFVGAVTEDLPSLVSPAGIEGLTVTDIVNATNAAAADLKAAGADVVVLLVHEGSPSTNCASANFTDPATVWGNISQNASADVDAIISGHTHLAYNCTINDRPVVSAGQYGTNLNQLVFTVDDGTGEVTGVRSALLPLMTPDPDGSGPGLPTANYPADPAVTPIVNDAVTKANELGAQVLGQIEAPVNRAKLADGTTENRGGESTLGNQVAEVHRWATENPESGSAQIAFMNPGGLRADMTGTVNGGARDVTYKQAASVQPFANTLVNMDLTGAQIETALEQQWQRDAGGSVPSRPFLRLGASEGFSYTYVETPATVNGTATFRGEVTGMWLDGVEIDPATTYSVTVNSFLASGGDNFREFANGTSKADTGKVDLQAMVDYMAAFAPVGSPLPVDYSQRAVEVHNVAEHYELGGDLTFNVESWTMSAPGDVKDTEIQVKLGDTVLGTAPLDNTIGTVVYDQYGKATIDVPLPADVPVGVHDVTLVGPATGTAITVPITISRKTSTVTGTDVTMEYGRSATMAVTVTADGVVPTGVVTIKSNGTTIGSGTLTNGATDATIGAKRLPIGVHEVRVAYAGNGSVKPSSTTATVTVTKATPTIVRSRTEVEYGKTTVIPVRVAAPGLVPTGTVELSVDGTVIGTGTLENGADTVDIAAKVLPPSSTAYTVTISYSGDDLVKAGDGTAVLVVRKATPTVTGTDVTMRAGTVSSMRVEVTADNVVPTGRVVLSHNDVILGAGTLTDGVTSARIGRDKLPASDTPYTVTVRYVGDGFVKTGSTTAQVTVNP
ncbi:ExeM/NucH family extracellular endonuclease [Nocardioides antri]|uniref:ExeM/NucH family extracellular endonuclease n=1 Tax=Nocardioides antri TaxID=2607659 RepID=A0A5B1M2W3_9ACTN|nr:ExeM/NucH family extracellular endonuclease [Nocardioides antri]KAA1426499.1 ExeM/NucH family extracellular endonuclease [Nocardioides antri]